MTEPNDHTGRLESALEGRYTIERKLGEGGMATVYVADDVRHDRKVAIKVLRPELAAVIGGDRFLTEIKTTANLQHPHILPLFDSGEADGFLFYVMPLLEDASLRDRIARDRQLPVDEAVRIAKAVASALDYAHRQGIIHRDIKPANILLQDGQPVVADFGIALAVSAAGGGRLTETGLSLGTPSYMSPEQATADYDPGPQSDVYSLGCVLYEMLTGEPPFTGSTAQAILGKIIMGKPTLPTQHRLAVPAHIEAVLLRALETLPADRFQTAEAFAAALDDTALTHGRQAAALAAARASSGAWISQGASRIAVGAIVLLAAWAAVVTLTPADPLPPRPVTRVVLDEDINGQPLALSRDGRWLATSTDDGMIRLRRLDQETAREIEVGFYGGPLAFSPDGRFLLIAEADGISRVPVEGGSAIPVAEGDAVFGADWSEDDRIVYVGLRGMYIVPSTGGEPDLLLEAGPFTMWDPRFLPGGRHVIYASGDVGQARGEIRILDLEARETRVVIEDGVTPQYVNTGHLLFVRGDQSLFAAPFDVKTAEVTGPAQQVMDSVTVTPFAPSALYQVSDAGTAVFGRGTPIVQDANQSRYTLVDRSGVEEFLSVPPGQIDASHLSPDGRLLAYQRDTRVYVYDRLLGRNTPLTPEGSLAGTPLWSRDGTQIAYFLFDAGGVTVFTIPADGSRAPRALADLGAFGGEGLVPLSWGPDDASVLVETRFFAVGANSDLGILYLGSDTTFATYLRADWAERSGAISPDGRWVAYLSDESEEFRLYVRSFPEPGDLHDVSPAGQVVRNKPLWARDGSALYWRAGGAPSWPPA